MPTYDGQDFSPPAPVATVSVMNPDTGAALPSVSMLIDTGADISVLPGSAVESLALAAGDRAYEVMGYDNTVRERHSVRATLVFSRRRFTGQFLVLDQEVGVLGRDVLNHFVLVLDGPNEKWDSR
jgi:hypothetical protein